ncbi:MAG: methyltransferase domain-containing protein [Terracidiphilus sp.]|nr:methyltransferase domain-containing protein [Terracidiphilus sp.]
MGTQASSSRWSQIVAWAVTSLFFVGLVFTPVGASTQPIMGVWFVGTQKPRRGFLWMLAFTLIPGLLIGWRRMPLNGLAPVLAYLGSMLLVAALSVLPFTFHRLVSQRLPGFFSTLPLPLATAAIPFLALALHIDAVSAATVPAVLIAWFAAAILWLWNRESHATGIVFGAGFLVATGFEVIRRFHLLELPDGGRIGIIDGQVCLGGALLLSVWALLHPRKERRWASRLQSIARLQSPFTGEPVTVVCEHGKEILVSSRGERFPVRDGIPAFLKPEDLQGDNGKYNHMYETIAGFYDDTQRVACALRGLDRDSYFLGPLSLLDVKTGDTVLETSVGTGLNFKYLPQGVKLTGLDLSPEMLANCEANLRRWKMEADLYLGNAESLPFADASFDVVFHAGGINFFNDRAKAIREMIRVAKPGSLLMITDETEEYAKKVYEKMPIASGYYSNRKEAVTTPVDLVPPEMQEIHLEMIKGGLFYAITFRKPIAMPVAPSGQPKPSMDLCPAAG